MKAKKRTIATALLALLCVGTSAQQPETFSVATLNVDGLPQKILVVNVNADGPGAVGTARIGKYLMKKGYDIVCMQEDFNYHDVLIPWMEDDYANDTWSGDIGIEGRDIDFLHLQNHRFECDGLCTFWKKDITLESTERTPWNASFGKFSHALDDIITKGFRRYNVTLANGLSLLVYNMHMDASDDKDELEGKDAKDKEARQVQWQQLKDEILSRLDTRPIIIMGDMNSFYGQDNVKAAFIDAINSSGKGTVTDVWVELQNKGLFPETKDDGISGGEVLDKILYVNPSTGTQIKAVSMKLDKEGYLMDGKPLGDHYPLSATFQIVGNESSSVTGVNGLMEVEQGDAEYYNLGGQRIGQPTKGLVIERQHQDNKKRIIK